MKSWEEKMTDPKQESENQSCASCRYYHAFEDEDPDADPDEPTGDCRRYPPRLLLSRETMFPQVPKGEWCGEYVPRS